MNIGRLLREAIRLGEAALHWTYLGTGFKLKVSRMIALDHEGSLTQESTVIADAAFLDVATVHEVAFVAYVILHIALVVCGKNRV